MSTLIETFVWEAGIYQIETSDPVIGGPDGISNLQAKQLANRTSYLKQRIDDHEAAADPHPQYLTPAEGNVAYEPKNAASTAMTAHTGEADPHTAYLNQARGDARYSRSDHGHAGVYEPSGAVAAHAAATDPHPQYLTQSEGDARYEQAGGSSAMTNHINAADPHPQYLLPTEGDARYSQLGHHHNGVYEPAGAVSSHAQAADPHTVYLNQARGDARYSQAGHAHNGLYDPIGSGQAARDWAYSWAVGAFPNFSHFGSSLAANGYQRLPSGLILQWGALALPDVPEGNYAFSQYAAFPIAFPNACLQVIPGKSGDASALVVGVRNISNSQFNAYAEEWSTVAQSGVALRWFAIGF